MSTSAALHFGFMRTRAERRGRGATAKNALNAHPRMPVGNENAGSM